MDDGLTRGRGEEEIDESRPGNLDLLDERRMGKSRSCRDQARDVARLARERLRKRQRDVRRVVAMRGLLRPLECDCRHIGGRKHLSDGVGELHRELGFGIGDVTGVLGHRLLLKAG